MATVSIDQEELILFDMIPLWSAISLMEPAEARALIRALACKDAAHAGGLPPALERWWRAAVAETRLYAALCQRVRGTYLHFSAAELARLDEATRASQLRRTVQRYRVRYGEEPSGPIWESE